ncbi:hypothetical protein C8R42DRAFT_637362 [Lentinula raphanica]|nr:hypothetical protein C8R42DRAFT_637362 [Lentinula raphanica]
MSLFHFSCSRQEIQAALEYFSANSSTLPASVHQFHQTLQTQIIAANSTSRTSLQANIHPLPTPSPSPPRTLGVGESHLPHAPLFLTTSAPWIHTTDEVQRRDADNPSVPLPSAYSGDPVDALLSGDEIQSRDFLSSQYAKRLDVNDLILSNNEGREKTDLVGPTDTVGLLGNTIFSGEHTEAGKSLQEDNSTNTRRKKNNGADTEDGEEGRGSKRSRCGKSRGDKSGDKSRGAGGSRRGGGGGGGGRRSGCPRNGSNIQRRTRSGIAAGAGSHESHEGLDYGHDEGSGEESLKNLALRCAWSKSMSLVGTFCRMLNELMFAAKVNSIFHTQKMANPSKMPSLEGIIRNLQSEGFGGRELGIWLSSGSRWARLASAASKRLTYRIGSEISCTVLAEVCHQIRSPSLAQLQRIYRLPSTLDIANVEATDWFFDLFYHRMVVNVPRDGQLWKDVLKCAPTEGNSTSFYSFNQRHLNSSFGTEKPAVTAWDDVGPLSDEELEESLVLPVAGDTKVALPPPKIIAFFGDILKVETDIRGTLHVIKSCFSSRRALAETGLPYTVDNRNDWTEEQRKRVDKAERPRTLEKFAEKIQQHYDSSLGTIRAQQKWLVLTKAAIAGREVKVVDAEDNTIVTVDASLPEEYRSCLENAVAALCKATAVDILDLNTSQLPADRLFDVWHLSYYARYGQSVFSWKMYQGKEIPPDFHPLHIKRQDGSKVNHCQFFVRASKDLQMFGKEFAALSEAIGPVLQKIVEKRLARDYDLFGSEVEAMVDVMPLQDFTPVRPFTGLVINLIKTEGTLEAALSSVWAPTQVENCAFTNLDWLLRLDKGMLFLFAHKITFTSILITEENDAL